jgi:RNA polymerase sigma-70 factor (ECF subfamily)
MAEGFNFERAYEQHYERVVAAARRILGNRAAAEDVAQEVFTQLWRRPDAWDRTRGSLETYLGIRARSRAIDVWRSERSGAGVVARLVESYEAEEDFAEVQASRLNVTSLREAVAALPRPQRTTLWLVHWGGLSYAEVGAVSGVPTSTAKSRARLAVERLRLTPDLDAHASS